MTKSPHVAVEWLIDTVKEALDDGRATIEELEEWLLAAILLEELHLDDEQPPIEGGALNSWPSASKTLH